MAEVSSSNVGRVVPMEAEIGASMHGVTGYEASSYVKDMKDSDESVALDRWGRPYQYPVDSLHRSKSFQPWRIFRGGQPHYVAFWCSTFCFFCTFMGTFAPAALITVIRDNLNLTKPQIGNANIAAVIGTVASRITMGLVCDAFGPRIASCLSLFLTAPFVFGIMLVQNVQAFTACRFFIGTALATFVSNQYWTTAMFAPNVVGVANGFSAGIGNSGGGFTHIFMTEIYTAFHHKLGWNAFQAWRFAFFIPGSAYLVAATLTLLFGEDTPDGPYKLLKEKGVMKKEINGKRLFWFAMTNYRTWIMTLAYAFSFGIELAMDNILGQYFVDYFNLPIGEAGHRAASFGIMAVGVRGFGGFISDTLAKRFGIRGRIWNLYLSQSFGAMFAMIMSRHSDSYDKTVGLLIAFAFMTIYATGATYGITPFITKRALGVCSGFIGAGGNAGAAVIQAAFFTVSQDQGGYSTPDGIFYMGAVALACTAPVLSLYWPQWGGAFLPASRTATEEMYYLKDYTIDEIKAGDAVLALKFAAESRSQRGVKKLEEYERSMHGASNNNSADTSLHGTATKEVAPAPAPAAKV